jgi:hypothetical protein
MLHACVGGENWRYTSTAMPKKRARTERREAQREQAKWLESKLKLARLAPGGDTTNPLPVATASVIEPHARGLPCLVCDTGGTRVEEHAAREGLRFVRVRCTRCGHARELVFRIVLPS